MLTAAGPPPLRHPAPVPPPPRAAREAQDPRCQQGRRRVVGQGRGGQVDDSRWTPPDPTWFLLFLAAEYIHNNLQGGTRLTMDDCIQSISPSPSRAAASAPASSTRTSSGPRSLRCSTCPGSPDWTIVSPNHHSPDDPLLLLLKNTSTDKNAD